MLACWENLVRVHVHAWGAHIRISNAIMSASHADLYTCMHVCVNALRMYACMTQRSRIHAYIHAYIHTWSEGQTYVHTQNIHIYSKSPTSWKYTDDNYDSHCAVCMHTCIHAYACVCSQIHADDNYDSHCVVCMHAYIHTYMHACMRVQSNTRRWQLWFTLCRMHAYLHACMHTYIHACICMQSNICIHGCLQRVHIHREIHHFRTRHARHMAYTCMFASLCTPNTSCPQEERKYARRNVLDLHGEGKENMKRLSRNHGWVCDRLAKYAQNTRVNMRISHYNMVHAA